MDTTFYFLFYKTIRKITLFRNLFSKIISIIMKIYRKNSACVYTKMYRVKGIFFLLEVIRNTTAIAMMTIFGWFFITATAVIYNEHLRVAPDIDFKYYTSLLAVMLKDRPSTWYIIRKFVYKIVENICTSQLKVVVHRLLISDWL